MCGCARGYRMEHVKKDWQRSEGRVRSIGKSDLRTDKKLKAYHPAERERSRENRSNEMLRMENSYGGIAIGASRRKKMTMVFHEKRRHNGPSIKEDERKVEGSRMAPLRQLEGDFRTNSHDRVDSAMIYRENLEESPVRMMRRLQEMMDENRQESGERNLPFLDRRKDRQEREDTERALRESLEKRRKSEYDRLREKRESLRQESAEKEQMRRQFYQNLSFAREKSQRLMHREGAALWEGQGAVWGHPEEEGISGEDPAALNDTGNPSSNKKGRRKKS